MTTVLRRGPYRAYFFSHEPNEPPHIHVDRAGCSAKYWVGPVALARNRGFHPHELTRIRRMLDVHETEIREGWNEHFGT